MVELYSPVVGETLNFDGFFSFSDVFRVIDKYYRTKGFDKKIVFDEQYDTDSGTYIHLKTEYYKKTDAYVRIYTRMWIYVNDYVMTEQVVDGKKVRIGKGKLSITFDAFVQTEYFNTFGDDKPWKFLFRVLWETVMPTKNKINYWRDVVTHIVYETKSEIASYLNINKFLYER